MTLKNLASQIALYTVLVFQWNGPTGGVPATGYKLVYGDSPTTRNIVVDVGNVLTKNLDVDFTTPKYFAVKSYNAFGDGGESAVVAVGKPGAPTNLTIQLQ